MREWPARSGRWNAVVEVVAIYESEDRIYLSFVATFPKFFRNLSEVLQTGNLRGMITQTTE